ncbi:hypothetical protein FLGE108171_15115 [Flavobacterium gelidilacus]|uniref:hypothetical protein n=1 Tax=Flavobacterium gelidilacus TaxID=206041 RepID=UPI000423A68D|nr:hypothetical protein [Flavobacterium gelidilacus]
MNIDKVIDIKDCKRGYVLRGITNHHVKIENGKPIKGHFMVFYDSIDGFDFQGAMITSKDYNGKNAPMQEEHFFIKNNSEEYFKVTFNNSHMVNAKLHKFYDMGEFIFVGLLTPNGVTFMEELISDLPLITWEKYLNNNI